MDLRGVSGLLPVLWRPDPRITLKEVKTTSVPPAIDIVHAGTAYYPDWPHMRQRKKVSACKGAMR